MFLDGHVETVCFRTRHIPHRTSLCLPLADWPGKGACINTATIMIDPSACGCLGPGCPHSVSWRPSQVRRPLWPRHFEEELSNERQRAFGEGLWHAQLQAPRHFPAPTLPPREQEPLQKHATCPSPSQSLVVPRILGVGGVDWGRPSPPAGPEWLAMPVDHCGGRLWLPRGLPN